MSYKRFDKEDVVVSAESITSPVWTGDKTVLNTFFTSSTQTGGTPYGASHYSGNNNNTSLSKDESILAQALGRRVATLAKKLAKT